MMHIGDEAMFEKFVAQARRRGIHDIVAVSSNPDDTATRYGLESVPRLGLSGDRASMIAQAPAAALPAQFACHRCEAVHRECVFHCCFF